MNCPICGIEAAITRETTGTGWFSGIYVCLRHGPIRAGGRILDDGERITTAWRPRCLEHGFEPVVQLAENHYRCVQCDTEMRMLHGRIRRFRLVQLFSGRRALAIM